MAPRKKVSDCAVVRGEVDLDAYAARDGEWREVGLAAPARRALIDAGLTKVDQLVRWTRSDLADLHGMGPNALKKLDAVLKERGASFLS